MTTDTLKLRILSDLHFEFHADGGESFVNSLSSEGDVVLLAGDISTITGLDKAINLFCDKFPHVVMVCGNHEFYGSAREQVLDKLDDINSKHSNFKLLDNSVIEIEGVRIVGSPLWFSLNKKAPKHLMNDFKLIHKFEEWVYEENKRAKSFLSSCINLGDIVVTHYLPSYQSVHPKYEGSALNPFFVCDVEDIILEKKPAYWIHGHTHESVRYTYGSTEVLANPFGYLNYETNLKFVEALSIEVPRGTS